MVREKKVRRPAYRPVPLSIRRTRRRAPIDAYVRFYCMARDYSGKRIRATFLVRVGARQTNREIYYWIVATCNAIKQKMIPEHFRNQVFSSFYQLLRGTPWIKVRSIIDYRVDMAYVR